jgi:hypothetical protein
MTEKWNLNEGLQEHIREFAQEFADNEAISLAEAEYTIIRALLNEWEKRESSLILKTQQFTLIMELENLWGKIVKDKEIEVSPTLMD